MFRNLFRLCMPLSFKAFLTLFLLGNFYPAFSIHAQESAKKPNIIMILVDDMGWGDLSSFGNKQTATPHLDCLAKEGIRFEQFYVNAPICSPSRCSIMTGQYPQRWQISSYLNHRKSNSDRGVNNWLSLEAPTIGKEMKKRGYVTGHFGKWHLGGQRDVNYAPPISDYGFDESLTNFEGMGPKLLPLTLKPGDIEPRKIWDRAEILGGPVTWVQRSSMTTDYVNATVDFIKRSRAQDPNQPFYINLWPDDVHSPFFPPVEEWKETDKERYQVVLKHMDRQLGALFDYIRNDPALKDDTMIVFCSDNGPDPKGGSAGPFRGFKTSLYEGGIRSPLIVWAPKLMRAEAVGSVDRESFLVAFDLPVTFTSLAGGDQSDLPDFDGENQRDTLLGVKKAGSSRYVCWRRPPDFKNMRDGSDTNAPDLAIREKNWKLVCDFDGSGVLLFDLSQDPSENQNLKDQHLEITKDLKTKLLSWQMKMPKDRGDVFLQEAKNERK